MIWYMSNTEGCTETYTGFNYSKVMGLILTKDADCSSEICARPTYYKLTEQSTTRQQSPFGS